MENGFTLCDTTDMREETLGSFIRWHRRKAGLSQKELGIEIGISDRRISSWETNRGFPGRDAITGMARVFEISLDEFKRFLTDDSDISSEATGQLLAAGQEQRRRQALTLIDKLIASPQKLDQWVEYGEWLQGRDESR
jgi:transcriptional regulator with XRE-family HTH domain